MLYAELNKFLEQEISDYVAKERACKIEPDDRDAHDKVTLAFIDELLTVLNDAHSKRLAEIIEHRTYLKIAKETEDA